MKSRALVLLALVALPPLALAADAPAQAVSATGPDADGAFLLAWSVTRANAGDASASLAVRVTNAAGDVIDGARDLGSFAFAAGTQRVNVSFLPAEGPGDYEGRLVLDGVESAPLSFRVESGAGASTRVTFEVPDAPTWLNLTSDSVNADGKSKLPGDAVVTRATLEDDNGVADVERVAWRVAHEGALVAEGDATVTATSARGADVEATVALSPLATGNHTLTLLAMRGGDLLAHVTRTFVVRDVAPVLLDAPTLALASVEDVATIADALVGDRNGFGTTPAFEVRTYRGSSRAEDAGVTATVGASRALPPADGYGRLALPVNVSVANGTVPGAYRVNVYADGVRLGAIALDVLPPPTLASVTLAQDEDGALTLVANGTGLGHVTLALDDGRRATSPFHDGAIMQVTATNGTVHWRVELRAHEGGRVLDAREGTWARAVPAFEVDAPASAARLPAAWVVRAPGWDVAQANATLEVLRWDGTPADGVTATWQRGRVRVNGPADLEPGRYEVRAHVAWPNGTSAPLSWHFEAGPWVRFALGAPAVSGREASVPLVNDGGVMLGALVVETSPRVAEASLALPDGRVVTGEARGNRWMLSATGLAPGETATLRVRLDDAPRRAGPVDLSLRVLALPGGG